MASPTNPHLHQDWLDVTHEICFLQERIRTYLAEDDFGAAEDARFLLSIEENNLQSIEVAGGGPGS
jgi:hypothetical protein